jgi:hypothetical protein
VGDIGPSLTGVQGPIGDVGPKGFRGAQGDQGPAGPTCNAIDVYYVCSSPEEAQAICDSPDLITVFSDNCTSIASGCNIYTDASCNACDGIPCLPILINEPNTTEIYEWDADATCRVLEIVAECGSPTPPPKSDRKLKEHIETLQGAMGKLLQIELKEYDWNISLPMYEYLKTKDKLHSIGIIAQQLEPIIPEVIFRNKDGYLGIHYSILNAYLVEAIKEQQKLIEEIDSDIKLIRKKL